MELCKVEGIGTDSERFLDEREEAEAFVGCTIATQSSIGISCRLLTDLEF
jgi:hypothetical protein